MASRATPIHSMAVVPSPPLPLSPSLSFLYDPTRIGPDCSPSSSYTHPSSCGTYAMKWNTSSSSVAARFSLSGSLKNASSALPNELCAARISSLDPMASPRRSAGKCDVKDLKLERVFPSTSRRPPSSSSPSLSPPSTMELGALNNTLRMACVAHALCVTCLAKNNPSGTSSPVSGVPRALSSLSLPVDDCHLNKNISPCTAAFSTPSIGRTRLERESSSRLHSSVNSTFRVPKDSMREVKTPGSDSMVHQSLPPEDPIVDGGEET
mmetsp:Transcript_25634/g.61620  ORF Transcript_25634/g.61620 Transcript_25634/m.61620 type:complete len:266 (-) Transcript_25634:51-848(-)